MENVNETFKLFGSLYAAEALAMLSKPSEAAEYLQPTRLGLGEQTANNINFSLDPSQPRTTLSAKHLLFLNLAVVHILKVRKKKKLVGWWRF